MQQLWKSFPAFRRAATDSTWIYRVALNTAISNFRKVSSRPANVSLTLQDFQIPDIDEAIADGENRETLSELLRQLTAIEKAIVLLYLEEKTYEEISEVVGISITNVGVRLNRIRNKLSKLVKTTSYEPRRN